jgi:hypothetical protein
MDIRLKLKESEHYGINNFPNIISSNFFLNQKKFYSSVPKSLNLPLFEGSINYLCIILCFVLHSVSQISTHISFFHRLFPNVFFRHLLND